MRTLIRGIQRDREMGKGDETQGTIFDGLLQSSLPPQELSEKRLEDEAVSIIGAGIASTEWTLTLACFHILDNPQIQRRLKEELATAIPDPKISPSLTDLEHLPYLTACVEESQFL